MTIPPTDKRVNVVGSTYAFLFGAQAQLEFALCRFGHPPLDDLLVQRLLILHGLPVLLVLLGGGLTHVGAVC